MADDNSRPFLIPRPNVAPIPVATSTKSDSDLIAAFLEYLTTERRLARNTVQGYGLDLLQATRLLPHSLQCATRDDLRQFFARLQMKGVMTSSLARKLSALRHFYQYPTAEEAHQNNSAPQYSTSEAG